MATQFLQIPAGTTSAIIPVTPLMSVLAGPAVLGGTATLTFASNPGGPFSPWSFGASVSPQSFRASINSYIQVSAATQAANVCISDMSGDIGDRTRSVLMSVNETFASGSSTTEQVIGSLRVPPGLLRMNGLLRFSGFVSMVNNANAKTLQGRIGGLAGTLFFQSGALASNANVNFLAHVALRGDGVSQAGFGSGLTNIGLGLGGATAYTLFNTTNYQNSETEFVVTATKATAADLVQLEALAVELLP
jgi:hypothetical protein